MDTKTELRQAHDWCNRLKNERSTTGYLYDTDKRKQLEELQQLFSSYYMWNKPWYDNNKLSPTLYALSTLRNCRSETANSR